MTDAGLIVLCSFISPFRAERRLVRDTAAAGEFIEIFVDTPLETAIARDPKGLYKRALAGEIKNFTGVDQPYESARSAGAHPPFRSKLARGARRPGREGARAARTHRGAVAAGAVPRHDPESKLLTLFYAANTCALASHITLEEAGADFETRQIDFAAAEQTKAPYLEINPKGRVPALMTGRGVLTETPAILAYVAQTHPQAKLAPLDDPFAFAELQAFVNYLARRCISPTPTAAAAIAGRMTRPRSRR